MIIERRRVTVTLGAEVEAILEAPPTPLDLTPWHALYRYVQFNAERVYVTPCCTLQTPSGTFLEPG